MLVIPLCLHYTAINITVVLWCKMIKLYMKDQVLGNISQKHSEEH